MKTLLDIMRVDIITANGKKHGFTRFLILSATIAVLSGLLFSPLMDFLILLVLSAITVSSLYQAAEQSNAEKMFAVLPVGRKQIVQARFLLAACLFAAMALLCVAVAPIAVLTKLYVSIWNIDFGEMLMLIGNVTGLRLSELGLYLIMLSAAFWLGMMILPRNMRRYLKTSGKIQDGKKMFRAAKKVLIVIGVYLGFEVVVAAIWGLSGQSALFGTLMMLVMKFIAALAQVGGGVLLSLILISAGIGSAVYQYVCAVPEFDEKEL